MSTSLLDSALDTSDWTLFGHFVSPRLGRWLRVTDWFRPCHVSYFPVHASRFFPRFPPLVCMPFVDGGARCECRIDGSVSSENVRVQQRICSAGEGPVCKCASGVCVCVKNVLVAASVQPPDSNLRRDYNTETVSGSGFVPYIPTAPPFAKAARLLSGPVLAFRASENVFESLVTTPSVSFQIRFRRGSTQAN